MNYLEKSDNELVELSKNDTEALSTLLFRYKPLVKGIARRFITYDDLDDLIQEGMIAADNAIRNFDTTKTASFKTFLHMCVTRRLCNVVRNNLSDKNRAVTLGAPIDCAIGMVGNDVELDLINSESEQQIWDTINTLLSNDEKDIFTYYLDGLSYSDIANKVGISQKKVDNTLQKIKKTLKKSLKY